MVDAAHSIGRICKVILPGSCLMQQLEASGALTHSHADLPSTSGCTASGRLCSRHRSRRRTRGALAPGLSEHRRTTTNLHHPVLYSAFAEVREIWLPPAGIVITLKIARKELLHRLCLVCRMRSCSCESPGTASRYVTSVPVGIDCVGIVPSSFHSR